MTSIKQDYRNKHVFSRSPKKSSNAQFYSYDLRKGVNHKDKPRRKIKEGMQGKDDL